MAYSFDISYPANTYHNIAALAAIQYSVIDKYDSCEWYASDCGPLSLNQDDQHKTVMRNNGYNISNLQDIKKIDAELSNLSKEFFISFICVQTKDDCEHIFYHPTEFAAISPEFQKAYQERIKHLSGQVKQIHDHFVSKYGAAN